MEMVIYLDEGGRLLEEKLLSQMILHPVMTEPHQEAAQFLFIHHYSNTFKWRRNAWPANIPCSSKNSLFANIILRTLIPLIVNIFLERDIFCTRDPRSTTAEKSLSST